MSITELLQSTENSLKVVQALVAQAEAMKAARYAAEVEELRAWQAEVEFELRECEKYTKLMQVAV